MHGTRCGGEPGDGQGYFYRPTVLSGVPLEARLTSEEIFGPVAAISVFDDEDDAVAAANDTEFGLVSYLYTRDLNRAMRVSVVRAAFRSATAPISVG